MPVHFALILVLEMISLRGNLMRSRVIKYLHELQANPTMRIDDNRYGDLRSIILSVLINNGIYIIDRVINIDRLL